MRVLDTLPRLAELSLEAARQAGSLAVSVVRTVAAPILGRRCDEDSSGWTRNSEPPASPVGEPPPPPSAPRRPRATTPAAAPVAVAPPAEPAHVDRGAVLVAESADSGAADGAGAEVRVAQPWDGYRALKAREITDRLATADAAMLAIVRLYESTHRRRRTVLAEVDRRLANGG